jgi:methyl-accepting chemotaxis protein WspA
MRNLKSWQKIALMTFVFMVPFAAVSYKMTAAINALGLDTAQRELRGLEYVAPALTLIRDLQEHRGMANASLNGSTEFADRLARARAAVENDIKAVDEVDARLGGLLETTSGWEAVRTQSLDLLKNTPSLSADESFARHSSLISDVIALVSDVGHSSNLTQDPDIHRSRLIDLLIFEGPQLTESMARARSLGAGVLIQRRNTEEQFDLLNHELVLVEFFGAKIDASVQQTLQGNDAFQSRLATHAQAATDAVLQATVDMGTLSRAKDTKINPDEYLAQLNRGAEAVATLESEIIGAVGESLTARVAALQREVALTLGAAVLGLLVVFALGLLIARDVRVSLKRVVDDANRIAIGDLTTPAPSTPRKDEIGELTTAFDQMIAALQETVSVAQRIAAGDLAVTVKPRSERDALGHALANMVEHLSTLVGDVQRSGIQVNTSVNQIAATAKQQQATATEIAATTTQISATSKEIASTSKELVKTMAEVSDVAEQSAALATDGQGGVARMAGTMRHVMDAAASINAKLAVLNEKAGGITQVVTTITKVADQTNLLSLNAAIEAEKAGEYGRGFAVVATEIRRLADQTAVATYDIEQMVKEIQSAVSAGVMGMDKFAEEVRQGMHDVQQVGDQLTQIIQQVQALAPRFESVNEGMQAQASGAEQITEALAQLGDAVHQTVESLRESNQVIDGLNHAATGMRSGVSRFKLAA